MAQGLPPAKKPSERAKTFDQQMVKNLIPSALGVFPPLKLWGGETPTVGVGTTLTISVFGVQFLY